MNQNKEFNNQISIQKKKVSSKLLSDHNLGCKFAVGAQSILAKKSICHNIHEY